MLKENRENTPMPVYPDWEMPDWLPDDELVTANGLSQEMRDWLDNSQYIDYHDDYHRAQQVGYETFVRRYGLKRPGRHDFCQHAISREQSCTPTQRKKWNSNCTDTSDVRYSFDHFDKFILSSVDRKQKRLDLITSQPYPQQHITECIDRMVENALVEGLDLMVSPRQSYHLPGYTALVAIARPGILS